MKVRRKELGKRRDKLNSENNKIIKNLPDHRNFILSTRKIISKQYQRKENQKSKEDSYAPMYNYEDLDSSDSNEEC